MKILLKMAVPAVIIALGVLACKGPVGATGPTGSIGPQGPAGQGGGSVDAGTLQDAISGALAGLSGPGPYTIVVSGLDLSNDWVIRNLLWGIADGLNTAGLTGNVKLDASDCSGYFVGDISPVPEVYLAKYTALTFPSTVTTMPGMTSSNNFETQYITDKFSSLTEVTFPGLIDVVPYLFYECTTLSSINLPLAESIGDYAFYQTPLTSIDLPLAESTGNFAFSGCTSLASVSLPLAESIGYGTFSGCTSLASITLPLAEIINWNAFQNCADLASVSLPLVERIGTSAFLNCETLSSVNLGATMPPTLPTYATDYGWFRCNTTPSNTVAITVPNGTLAAYNNVWGLGGAVSFAQGSKPEIWGTNHPAIAIAEAP
jgi:hypothetical protein